MHWTLERRASPTLLSVFFVRTFQGKYIPFLQQIRSEILHLLCEICFSSRYDAHMIPQTLPITAIIDELAKHLRFSRDSSIVRIFGSVQLWNPRTVCLGKFFNHWLYSSNCQTFLFSSNLRTHMTSPNSSQLYSVHRYKDVS